MKTKFGKLFDDFLAAILDFQNGGQKILKMAIFQVPFYIISCFKRLGLCF